MYLFQLIIVKIFQSNWHFMIQFLTKITTILIPTLKFKIIGKAVELLTMCSVLHFHEINLCLPSAHFVICTEFCDKSGRTEAKTGVLTEQEDKQFC